MLETKRGNCKQSGNITKFNGEYIFYTGQFHKTKIRKNLKSIQEYDQESQVSI